MNTMMLTWAVNVNVVTFVHSIASVALVGKTTSCLYFLISIIIIVIHSLMDTKSN